MLLKSLPPRLLLKHQPGRGFKNRTGNQSCILAQPQSELEASLTCSLSLATPLWLPLKLGGRSPYLPVSFHQKQGKPQRLEAQSPFMAVGVLHLALLC